MLRGCEMKKRTARLRGGKGRKGVSKDIASRVVAEKDRDLGTLYGPGGSLIRN